MFGEERIGPAVVVSVVLAVGACASGLRSAVKFDGRAEPQLVRPAEVAELRELPAGYESTGEVTARCRVTQSAGRLQGAWLSDVDCSEGLLVRALREKVAAVGGELMVARECGSTMHKGALGQRDVSCRAEVARPTGETLSSRSPAGPSRAADEEPSEDGLPPASAAWRIRVDFTPAAGVELHMPRRGALVRELAVMPVSHVRLGDVVTRCDRGCDEAATVAGVRTVAGRMGATDVVGVRCTRRGAGLVCLGTAAAYETDPERDPRAR